MIDCRHSQGAWVDDPDPDDDLPVTADSTDLAGKAMTSEEDGDGDE